MKRLNHASLCTFTLIALLVILAFAPSRELAAQVPPRTEQPAPDIFQASGIANMQTLNPVTVRGKAQRTASYRLLTMPGCVAGTVPGDMTTLASWLQDVNFSLVRNDAAADFTIRINCGNEHIRICGAVNIFCLGRGFPYVPDVEISDLISNWPQITRLSILCHEICGHAIGTWNEQYCTGTETAGICKGLTRFTPAPGWIDFMNTGENSRHGFEAIEVARWERTMYPLQVACESDPCWDGTRWRFVGGWSFEPDAGCGNWYDQFNNHMWGACDASWGGRYSPYLKVWAQRGSPGFFIPATGNWVGVP